MAKRTFNKDFFIRSVKYNVRTLFRREIEEASEQQIFQAVGYAVKDAIMDAWIATQKEYEKNDPKIVYYMSMEFLMGRALGNNLINLTFCCQDTTVITDFSELEEVGREHCIKNDGLTVDEYYSIDGRAEALKLIRSGNGTVTPYGVVYDNGMELKQLYTGRNFPSYNWKVPTLELETAPGGEAEGHFDLPMPDRRLQREIERAGLDQQDIPLPAKRLHALPEQG